MGKKLDRVYNRLLDGATKGLVDDDLYQYILKAWPKTTSKRIVKASLLALSDPSVKDRKVLDAIYALAIRYRLMDLGVEENTDEDDDDKPAAPLVTEDVKRRLETSTAVITEGETSALH